VIANPFRLHRAAAGGSGQSSRERIQRLQAAILEIPPERAALLLSVGLVLGVFPINGIPTVLCLIAAFVFRLNAPALQLLNSLSTPLQLALLLPLARVGQKVCGPAIATNGAWTNQIAGAAVHAVAGWAIVCIPAGALLYLALLGASAIVRWEARAVSQASESV
jgi:hypothetical protein